MRLTHRGDSVSLRAVKILLPLLTLTLFVTACSNQNARRRSLYSPSQPSGPYTSALEDGSWKDKGQRIDVELEQREEQRKIEALGAKPK